jgi:hypothetical protein
MGQYHGNTIMAITWQEYVCQYRVKNKALSRQEDGKKMARVWQYHGNNMVKNMTRARQEHGKHMAMAWQQDHSKNMATTMSRPWQEHGKIMAITWQ